MSLSKKKKRKKKISIILRHGCSPANLLHIFRTPSPKNTSGGLLLKISFSILLSEKIQGCRIIFPTEGVEITNKILVAKL